MKKRAGSASAAPSSSALGKAPSFKRITTFPGSPPHMLPTMPSNPIWPQSSDCPFLAAPACPDNSEDTKGKARHSRTPNILWDGNTHANQGTCILSALSLLLPSTLTCTAQDQSCHTVSPRSPPSPESGKQILAKGS